MVSLQLDRTPRRFARVVTRSALVVFLALVFVLPGNLGSPSAPSAVRPGPVFVPLVTVGAGTLHLGSLLATTAPSFFGLVLQTSAPTGVRTDSAVGRFVNATPFHWFTYTQQTDQCNITSGRLYQDDGSYTTPCGFSLPAYQVWCGSRSADCHTILVLPGENNNSGEDANMARYIFRTLGFQPDYFAVGNEPMLWTHYGIPWSQWRTTDNSVPTPLAYAFDVKAAIHAVRSVDPHARFIGIEADCECSQSWFTDVAKIDGASLSAVAYHTYPSTALLTTETPTEFLAPLASTTNLSTSLETVRQALQGHCTGCGTLPIFVTEYNSGPGWSPSNYAGTYLDALFLAASTIQALRANATMLSIFNLQTYQSTYGWSMLNGQDSVGPEGLLYSRLLAHLALGTVYATRVSTTVGGIWAVETGSGSHRSLLVVNTNLTERLSLKVNGQIAPLAGTDLTIHRWNPGAAHPWGSVQALASSYGLPPEGMLLLDWNT